MLIITLTRSKLVLTDKKLNFILEFIYIPTSYIMFTLDHIIRQQHFIYR